MTNHVNLVISGGVTKHNSYIKPTVCRADVVEVVKIIYRYIIIYN